MSRGSSCCRWRSRASLLQPSGITPGGVCAAGCGRCSSLSLSTLRCLFCSTREGNSLGVFTVSLNERCGIHCDFRPHARRGTGGRDVAKSHARRVLLGGGVARPRILLFPAGRRIRRTCPGVHLHRRSGGCELFFLFFLPRRVVKKIL